MPLLALTSVDLLVVAILLVAIALGVVRARRRMAMRRKGEPLRSIVLYRSAPSRWSEERIRDVVTELLGEIEESEVAAAPAKKAAFMRMSLSGGRRLLVIDTDAPYMAEREAAAKRFTKPEVQRGVAEHTAWTAIDALGAWSETSGGPAPMEALAMLVARLDDDPDSTLLYQRRDLNTFAPATENVRDEMRNGSLKSFRME
ncbi:MAG: hypothetical protein JNM94_05590 [Phycisphaerae bacterium]|nr:hypothetical protein [Phycisphaerae bacterium]